MEELNADVDVFVVMESKTTFSGKPKELEFFKNRHRFSKFRHKIQYVVYRGGTSNNAWDNERWQRNYFKNILQKICFDSDLICLSDVDEIPNFRSLKPQYEFHSPYVCLMDLYRYGLNFKVPHSVWRGTKMMYWGDWKLKFREMEDFRTFNSWECKEIKNGGWHFSYFGDAETIVNKIESFSHTEFDRDEFKDKNKIKNLISKGSDLFNRPSIIEEIDIEENNNLPKFYKLLKI